jgi:hypothetical protein
MSVELGTNEIDQKIAIYNRRYDKGEVEIGFFKNKRTVRKELVESVTIIDQGEAVQLLCKDWYENDAKYVPGSKRTFETKIPKAELAKMTEHILK